MIEAFKITKIFPGVVALEDVSFTISKGEIVGLLGPNGSGKTTLLRILTSYIPPTFGKASINGLDVTTNSLKIRKLIGYMPENNPLYDEMRVKEYLKFRSIIKEIPPASRNKLISGAISRCGLAQQQNRIIGHLSKGLKQRVGIADAIISDPPILILDEPTIGLDPSQAVEVREMIRNFVSDKTVIISTHILPEVEIICRKIMIIKKKIVAYGTKQEILQEHGFRKQIRVQIKSPVDNIKEVLATINNIGDIQLLKKDEYNTFRIHITNDADIRAEIYRCAVANRWEIKELTFEEISLERIFIQLTS